MGTHKCRAFMGTVPLILPSITILWRYPSLFPSSRQPDSTCKEQLRRIPSARLSLDSALVASGACAFLQLGKSILTALHGALHYCHYLSNEKPGMNAGS